MVRDIPLYLLTVALLGVAVYLRSPMIAASIVALWGLQNGKEVLTRQNRDKDILGIVDEQKAQRAKMELLQRDVYSVAERAKTILGETYL